MWKRLCSGLAGLVCASGVMLPLASQPARAQTTHYCRLTSTAIAQKDALRQVAMSGDSTAEQQYKALIQQHGQQLQQCRDRTWPRQQALWLRLYPCDINHGALEKLMDQIVDWGYNTIYVETFYNGTVLLPEAQNQTPWPSVIRSPNHRNTDMLAEAIAKGHERGLKVYSWMFSMNFGYAYAQRGDRQQALALNGYGQTSLAALRDEDGIGSEEAFIDPYSPQAKQDYAQMLQAVLQRRPDGVLFDYIRYPKGEGSASIASRVQDLWIYGPAAQQSLYSRATNSSGQELIQRYLSQGQITEADVNSVTSRYPGEADVQWQGRSPSVSPSAPLGQRRAALQNELWQLSVAHAMQGVVDFFNWAIAPVEQQQIPAGAVFFPRANAALQSGYDSRLQPWDRFPQTTEWHPMAYGVCGETSCIVSEVERVLSQASSPSQVRPVLAGVWGSPMTNRPSLEAQMSAIQRVAPQIQSVSHFAYSWQDPQTDRERKFCRLN
ncbi:MAG: family 10 glycosylhydrolase [Elainellaceae cyanobacterium]